MGKRETERHPTLPEVQVGKGETKRPLHFIPRKGSNVRTGGGGGGGEGAGG